jgi:hypothetical protein
MTSFYIHCATLGMALCACEVVETTSTTGQATTETQGREMQGREMQGREMQGTELQGMAMQGIRLDGATLSGAALQHVRVERGELVAERGATTLRGASLVGAQLFAQLRNIEVTPPATAVVAYRVTAIDPELAQYDPTNTGNTLLYTLEQWIDETGSWQPACPADADGRRVAIPLAATWDEHGDRIVSSSLFTFACTTGVIAKCYRWGYRPWVTGYGDLVAMHQTCTRLARADYCGVGVPHTRDGTTINVWDNLPSPGPIQRHGGLLGLPPPGMLFEAGWNTEGAVCLSHSRWILQDGLGIAALCPDRLVPPGLLGETVCDTLSDVLGLDSNARMFDEAFLNLVGP